MSLLHNFAFPGEYCLVATRIYIKTLITKTPAYCFLSQPFWWGFLQAPVGNPLKFRKHFQIRKEGRKPMKAAAVS